MSTLQIRIDTEHAKAMKQGNVFNAERDNNGKGTPMKDFINLL